MSTLEKALPKPKIELYSGQYFAACGLGGIIGISLPPFLSYPSTAQLSQKLQQTTRPKLTPLLPACGPTHTAVTPLDLVKCRRQVDSALYKSNLQAWRTIYRSEGLRGVFFGWSPTFVGYCFQGGGKYGFYEVFKYTYGEKLFPGMNPTAVFLAASASAEFLADIALCPFESIKVRMQTTLPPFASSLREGMGKVIKEEGYGG